MLDLVPGLEIPGFADEDDGAFQTCPKSVDVCLQGEIGEGDGEIIGSAVDEVKPFSHGGVFVLHAWEVYEEIPGLVFVLVMLAHFKRVVPLPWLVYYVSLVLLLLEHPNHGILFEIRGAGAQFDVWTEKRQGGSFGEEIDGPFIYAHEEDTAVESEPVFVAEEVYVREGVRGWKEERPRDGGVEDDSVGVEPAACTFVRKALE